MLEYLMKMKAHSNHDINQTYLLSQISVYYSSYKIKSKRYDGSFNLQRLKERKCRFRIPSPGNNSLVPT